MRTVLFIFILLVLLTIATMLWKWWRARMDLQRLRENPPERVAYLVRLPREAEQSNVKMTRFFARMERLTSHDSSAVPDNSNVVSAGLVGSGSAEGQMATVRFIIWTPVELADRVMLELQECYEGQAQVSELDTKDDPLGQWIDQHMQVREWQEQEYNKPKS